MRKALIVRTVLALAVVAAAFAAPSPADANGDCFVDDTASGANDGTSWEDAYTDLNVALTACAAGEIWVAAGVYLPGPNPSWTFIIPADTRVYGGFAGTESSVDDRNPSANVTILSGDVDNNDANHLTTHIDNTVADIVGANSYHVVTMQSTPTDITTATVLDSFTITGGDGGMTHDGGGLACFAGGPGQICSPTLSQLTFTGNRAYYGGAIYNGGNVAGAVSSPAITFSYFAGNSAYQQGGGVYNDGGGGTSSPSFGRVTFEDNDSGYGGAVSNHAVGGGASNPTFTEVIFHHNLAGGTGGAVYNYAFGGTSSPTFGLVTFTGNDAGDGGGAVSDLASDDGLIPGVSSPIFTNVTFDGNGNDTTLALGGGLHSWAANGGEASPTLAGVTFGGNTSGGSGGGMAFDCYGGGTGTPTLVNVIMWEDIGGELYVDCVPTISYSVIQGSGGSGGSWDTGLGTDGGGNLEADPHLAPLKNNGGFSQTMALVTGSSAIDAGDDASCSIVDQRGLTRPADGDFDATARCDIGAYEYQGHLFADVPVASKEWMEPWVEMFYYNGITTGCGVSPLIYCPENPVTRASMAVFILRAEHGASYAPPAATHTFTDMPVAGKEWMEPWVDQLYAEGITTGCGAGPIFCPENPVTRAAMAVFILRALEGSSYTPPAATHTFADLPVVGKEWMEPWVDEFYTRGITTGCGASPLRYCPENPVTRAAMAVFIDRAYSLYP